MKIAFQVMTNPYTYQDVDTVMNLTEAALDKGHQVAIFLFCDSVLAANTPVRPIKIDRHIPQRMEKLAEKGVEIHICGLCYQYRGLDASKAVAKAKTSGLPECASLIMNYDRFISLPA